MRVPLWECQASDFRAPLTAGAPLPPLPHPHCPFPALLFSLSPLAAALHAMLPAHGPESTSVRVPANGILASGAREDRSAEHGGLRPRAHLQVRQNDPNERHCEARRPAPRICPAISRLPAAPGRNSPHRPAPIRLISAKLVQVLVRKLRVLESFTSPFFLRNSRFSKFGPSARCWPRGEERE